MLTITLAVSIVKAQKNMPIHSGDDNVADEAGAPLETPKGAAGDSAGRGEAASSSKGADSVQPALEEQCDRVARECNLSKREVDVLKLLARGYSSARIQAELYIAPGTVNYHTRNIYSKLGVHSKQALIDLVGRF